MLSLRLLDPAIDFELFREAYNWRRHKKHTGANEATLEDLLDDDPRQTTIGVFNGQYCAMFLLYEDEPGKMAIHFTTRPDIDRGVLIRSCCQLLQVLFAEGVTEVSGWIVSRNRAYRGLALDCGFQKVESREFYAGDHQVLFDRYVAIPGRVSNVDDTL